MLQVADAVRSGICNIIREQVAQLMPPEQVLPQVRRTQGGARRTAQRDPLSWQRYRQEEPSGQDKIYGRSAEDRCDADRVRRWS
jgi:hypothetical protein